MEVMRYSKLIIPPLIFLLQGCAGMYFKDAGTPPPAPEYTLDQWPYPEYWTGIVFNGNKIGFTHLEITADDTIADTYLIRSEASLRFHFLHLDKQVKLLARDWVNADLTLQRFSYDYDLDGNIMTLSGEVNNKELRVLIETSAGPVTQTYPLEEPVYPTSIINLYPVYHGLHLNAEYEYSVYDGESQRLATVNQDIVSYENSELFEGAAFKIKTRMHGASVTSWINEQAQPLLEISMNGVFIAGLESESQAKRYLAQAALSKDETLINFSLVRTDQPIETPRRTTRLELEIIGADGAGTFLNDGRQQCIAGTVSIRCAISGSSTPVMQSEAESIDNYLDSSIAVPKRHPLIRKLAGDITRDADSDLHKMKSLLDWLGANIQPEIVDVFSAVDVLEQRKAECQGYSFLFASFARSLGIPTRVVNGLVYSETHAGFLYHTWVESLIDGQWQAIDPTFGQLYADATHIKLVEGENLADLTPLLEVIGRLSARVISVESS